MGVEEGGVDGDRPPHHLGPAGSATVIEWRYDGIELLVQSGGIPTIGTFRVCRVPTMLGSDRPSGDSLDVPFESPTVENAETRDTVVRGFHT